MTMRLFHNSYDVITIKDSALPLGAVVQYRDE